MSIKQILKAAMIPSVILIMLGVSYSLILHIPIFGGLVCCLFLPLLIVNFGIIGWTGHSSVKKFKLGVGGGAMAGCIASFLGASIGGLLSLMIGLGLSAIFGTGFGYLMAKEDGPLAALILGMGYGIDGLMLVFIFGVSVMFYITTGLILGAVGAIIAKSE